MTNDFYGYAAGAALTSASAAVTVTVAAQPAMAPSASNVGVKGTFTYTPAPGYTGPDSFTYTIANGVSGGDTPSITGKVSLTVRWRGGHPLGFVTARVRQVMVGSGSPFTVSPPSRQ